MSTQDEISIGDAVKVVSGVTDPDIDWSIDHDGEWWDRVSLAGWQGVVTNLLYEDGTPMIMVEWDAATLREVPKRWRKWCRENGHTDPETFGYMQLGAEDVEPAESRDAPQDRLRARHALAAHFEWDELRETLRDMVGVSAGDDRGGFVDWKVRRLRAPLLEQARQGYEELPGLGALKAASQQFEVELHEGSRWINGELVGEAKTPALLKSLREAGSGTLTVVAGFEATGLLGEQEWVEVEVVVSTDEIKEKEQD